MLVYVGWVVWIIAVWNFVMVLSGTVDGFITEKQKRLSIYISLILCLVAGSLHLSFIIGELN